MNLIEQVYNKIRKTILHGEIKPGTRLVETQLAEKYETSRTPIREALSMLKNEGLITSLPGGGVIVNKCSEKEVKEIMGIRKALETYALTEAFDNFTDVDIMQLEVFIKKAISCEKKNDIHAVFEANTELHNYIYEKSGNQKLKEIIFNLKNMILRYRIAALHYPGNMETSINNHTLLLEAIKQGNKELAIQRLAADIDSARDVVLKVYNSDINNDN